MGLKAQYEMNCEPIFLRHTSVSCEIRPMPSCPGGSRFLQPPPSDLSFARARGRSDDPSATRRESSMDGVEVNDDHVILDETIADQVSSWKNSRGLTGDAVKGHSCSGSTCSYTQIGDAYICEKTGRVHVCDDACREFVLDQSSGLLVCTISGHCFERFLCPDDEWDTCDVDQHQGGVTDEA